MHCSFVSLDQIQVYQQSNVSTELALVAINIMGESFFSHVSYYHGEMQLLYNNETLTDREYHYLTINNCSIKSVKVEMLQNTYTVDLRVLSIRVQNTIYGSKSFFYAEELGTSEVIIANCQFISNIYSEQLFFLASTSNARVHFIDCHFMNNKPYGKQNIPIKGMGYLLYMISLSKYLKELLWGFITATFIAKMMTQY